MSFIGTLIGTLVGEKIRDEIQKDLARRGVGAAIDAVIRRWNAPKLLAEAEEKVRQTEARLRETEERLCRVERRVHQAGTVSHASGEAVRAALTEIVFGDFTTPEQRELRSQRLMNIFRPMLGALTRHFEEHFTKERTAACIKQLLTPGPGDAAEPPRVTTLVRDVMSEQARGYHTAPWPVSACTAFDDLMNKGLPIFVRAEDLRVLAERNEYRNPTPDFWRYYRSTMVVPIRAARRAGANTSFVVAGFLCLDCKEPGRFGDAFPRQPSHDDNPEQFNLVAGIADALFWPLLLFSGRLKNPDTSPIPPYAESTLLLEESRRSE